MKSYKLTDIKMKTQNDTLWGEGIEHTVTEEVNELCSGGVIHAYRSPLMAAMFNPIHAAIKNPLLWECETSEPVADDGLKIGIKTCKTLKQIPLPEISTSARVRVAILCALKMYNEPSYTAWAEDWLSGKDRSESAAARATKWAAESAAESAARAAAWATKWAAESAAARAIKSAASTDQKIDFLALIEQAIKAEENENL